MLITDEGVLPPGLDGLRTGILIRDVDLSILIERVAQARLPVAVDIDTIRGLKPDDASLAFVVDDLGASIIITRRRPLAERAVEMGAIGLQTAHAYDSTGLGRSLPPLGAEGGVGTVVSPGLVLPHLSAVELAGLPRPVVAHGLIVRPADALACLAHADAIVLRPDAARFLASRLAARDREDAQFLTSIAIEE